MAANPWQNPDQNQNSGLMSLFRMLGIGGGLAGAGAGAYAAFGGGQTNPADVANKYLEQIPGQTKQYYDPYMQAGKGALSDLQNQYGGLLNNTGDVYNKLAGGYKESPGYQYALKSALGAGDAAAAAGGLLGSNAHQEGNMNLASDIASKDFNNYLKSILGLYGKGLEGEQGLNTQGFEANTSYGNMLGDILGQKAQYGYAGQAGQNQAKQQGISDIFKGLGTAALFS